MSQVYRKKTERDTSKPREAFRSRAIQRWSHKASGVPSVIESRSVPRRYATCTDADHELETDPKEELMRVLKMIGIGVVLFAFAPAVEAQTSSAEAIRLTILTFSEPVQLPGMTLPAGKYRFEMENPNTTSHTVKVSKEDGTIVGLFKTVSVTDESRDLKDTDVAVMWSERAAGQPQALREWYYPQRKSGEEFVYPRTEAMSIAAANRAAVPTEVDGRIVRIDASGNAVDRNASAASPAPAAQATQSQSQSAQAQAPAPAPSTAPARTSTQESESAQAASARASAQAPASSAQAPAQARTPAPAPVGTSGQGAAAEQRTLPRTASQLGLFGLMGGLSIAAAFAVRQLRLRLAARS
jgi:hypothetical protein